MITVATAVCVLFAGWLDRTDAEHLEPRTTRYDRVMGLVPLAAVAALFVWALAAPASLVHVFAGVSINSGIASTVRTATTYALVLSAGAAAIVWLRPRLSHDHLAPPGGGLRRRGRRVDGPHEPADDLPAERPGDGDDTRPAADGGPPGTGRADGQLRPPDVRQLARQPARRTRPEHHCRSLPSVSGYASIVNGNYEAVTHTHEQDDLDLGQLGSGTLDQLDLQEVVTVPEYFLVPLAALPRTAADITQVTENIGTDPVLPRGYGADYNDTAYPFYPGPRPALRAGQSTSWFFGESLQPAAGTVLFGRASPAGARIRFGILDADGSTRWGRSSSRRRGRHDGRRLRCRREPVSGCRFRCSAGRYPSSGSSSPSTGVPTSSVGRSPPRSCPGSGGWRASRRGTSSSPTPSRRHPSRLAPARGRRSPCR